MSRRDRWHARALNMQRRSPGWPAWGNAIHLAGQCVMAYLLRLRVLRLHFNASEPPSFMWQRASEPFAALTDEPFDRALVEADALVALAGGAARWLYKPAALSAQHIRGDDRLADSYLSATPDEKVVVPHWREYLRQRAVSMLTPAENQAVIARLAGRFADGVKVRPAGVYDAIEDALRDVRVRLDVVRLRARQYDRSAPPPALGMSYFVTHWGLNLFERRIAELGLDLRIDQKLYVAGIEEVGQLLMHSRRDLSTIPGIGRAALQEIEKRLDVWAFVLAPDTPEHEDSAAPSWLSAAHVYRREEGEAIYDSAHSPRFYPM